MDDSEILNEKKQKQEKLSQEIEGCVSLLFALILCAGCIAGLLILSWQVYGWLRLGVWHPLPISLFQQAPNFDRMTWVGLRKVIEPIWLWLLDIPLSVFIPFSTMALLGAFMDSTSNLIKSLFGIKKS